MQDKLTLKGEIFRLSQWVLFVKILITAPFSESALQTLRDLALEIDYQSWLETGKLHMGDSLLSIIKEGHHDLVIVEGDEIKEEVLDGCKLRLIGSVRGNPHNIDVTIATAKGIPVLAALGRNTNAVVELTICHMLCAARHIIAAERLLQTEFFVDDFNDFATMYNHQQGFELQGRTVGIIGLGRIGYEVAKRLQVFGMRILVHDPYIDAERAAEVGAEQVELDELLKYSDIVTVHCKPTEETRGMLGRREFGLMKKTAIFINTARASITDEYALLDALKSRDIAGAGLDVFSMEPVDCDNMFLALDNVTVTPHIGGDTIDTIERQSELIVSGIKAFLEGKIPQNALNPEVFDKGGAY
jgi:phosphoglycerate dehydrogenase-like enzyme